MALLRLKFSQTHGIAEGSERLGKAVEEASVKTETETKAKAAEETMITITEDAAAEAMEGARARGEADTLASHSWATQLSE